MDNLRVQRSSTGQPPNRTYSPGCCWPFARRPGSASTAAGRPPECLTEGAVNEMGGRRLPSVTVAVSSRCAEGDPRKTIITRAADPLSWNAAVRSSDSAADNTMLGSCRRLLLPTSELPVRLTVADRPFGAMLTALRQMRANAPIGGSGAAVALRLPTFRDRGGRLQAVPLTTDPTGRSSSLRCWRSTWTAVSGRQGAQPRT